MPEPLSNVPRAIRLMAAIAIAIGVALCALALAAQAMHPDESGLLILPTAFV